MAADRYLLQLSIGALLTWLLQINGLMQPIWRLHSKLLELVECDLCLGFWVHLFIGIVTGSILTGLFPAWFEPVAYASISSFLVHLLRSGWNSKFGYTIVE